MSGEAAQRRSDRAASACLQVSTIAVRPATCPIRRSLLVLSEVCKRMALPARLRGAVPFRSSTLTTILRNSFGGSSRTAVLVNLSPAIIHARDILTTLRFGANVAAIRNQPKISKRIDFCEFSLLARPGQASVVSNVRHANETGTGRSSMATRQSEAGHLPSAIDCWWLCSDSCKCPPNVLVPCFRGNA